MKVKNSNFRNEINVESFVQGRANTLFLVNFQRTPI
jgi:hypothetical protein